MTEEQEKKLTEELTTFRIANASRLPRNYFKEWVEKFVGLLLMLMLVCMGLLYMAIQESRAITEENRDVALRNRVVYCETLDHIKAPKSPLVQELCSADNLRAAVEDFNTND